MKSGFGSHAMLETVNGGVVGYDNPFFMRDGFKTFFYFRMRSLKTMYIPPHYNAVNKKVCIDFISRNPFGLLASNGSEYPNLTHLPFVLSDDETELISHMARANPHLHGVNSEKCTVVFSGPHAYIGTQHYEKKHNVPTWNYIAIHVHGTLEIVEDTKENISLMEAFISQIDPSFMPQWNALDETYKTGMLRGITPFKIRIENLQGKFKLSQNKTEVEQRRIIAHLATDEPILAGYMEDLLFGN